MKSESRRDKFGLSGNSGFTVIELMVVATLFTLITALSIKNLSSYSNSKADLPKIADKVISDFRLVQSYSLSSKKINNTFSCGFGIHYINPSNYVIYGGRNPSDNNCSSNFNYYDNQTPIIQSIVLDPKTEFTQSFDDIFFRPPDPTVYINNSTNRNAGPELITIRKLNTNCNNQNDCIYVCVYHSGKIEAYKDSVLCSSQSSGPSPTADISCNGSNSCTIPYNNSATLSWVSSNATSCSVAPGGWSGTINLQSTSNLTATTIYTLTCLNSQASATDTVTVTVDPPPPPTMVTNAATDVTPSEATLNGSGNPNGSGTNTTAWFRYSTTNPGSCNDSFGTRTPAGNGGSNLGNGTSPVNYSRSINGLSVNTTYYYCAIASNGGGTGFGNIISFTISNLDNILTISGPGCSPCTHNLTTQGALTLSTPGNYTITPNKTMDLVTKLFGSGGGGGAWNQSTRIGGGGGGGGAVAQKTITSLAGNSNTNLTIGGGGAGGIWVDGVTWTSGQAGGNTSFGAYVAALGGAGGLVGSTGVANGGTCTGADICYPGGNGGLGVFHPGDYANGGGGGGGSGQNGSGGNGGNATDNGGTGQPIGPVGGIGGSGGGGGGGRGNYNGTAAVAPGGGGGGGCSASGSCPPGLVGAVGKAVFDLPSILWANLINVSAIDDNLAKNNGVNNNWDAGAVSNTTINGGDGYIQFSTSENNKHKMVGLSNGDTDQNYNDIDFAYYLRGDGLIEFFEKGGSKGSPGGYVSGDIFTVALISGQIKYYKNSILQYTSLQAPVYPLVIDTSFYTTGGTITNASITSGTYTP